MQLVQNYMPAGTRVGFVIPVTLKSAIEVIKGVDISEHIVVELNLSTNGLSSPPLHRCHGFVRQCAKS